MNQAINTHRLKGYTAENYSGDRGLSELLADSIRSFWAEKGKHVRVWVEQEPLRAAHAHPRFSIRSNMVNGLPV